MTEVVVAKALAILPSATTAALPTALGASQLAIRQELANQIAILTADATIAVLDAPADAILTMELAKVQAAQPAPAATYNAVATNYKLAIQVDNGLILLIAVLSDATAH